MTYRDMLKQIMCFWQGYFNDKDTWDQQHYEEFVDWMYCHGVDVEHYLPYWK